MGNRPIGCVWYTCAGSVLTVNYTGGDYCSGPQSNRRVVISYTCGTVRRRRRRRVGGDPRKRARMGMAVRMPIAVLDSESSDIF